MKPLPSRAQAVLSLFELQRRVGRLVGITMRVGDLFDGLRKRLPVLEMATQECAAAGNPPLFQSASQIQFEAVSIYKPDGVLSYRRRIYPVRVPSQYTYDGSRNGFEIL